MLSQPVGDQKSKIPIFGKSLTKNVTNSSFKKVPIEKKAYVTQNKSNMPTTDKKPIVESNRYQPVLKNSNITSNLPLFNVKTLKKPSNSTANNRKDSFPVNLNEDHDEFHYAKVYLDKKSKNVIESLNQKPASPVANKKAIVNDYKELKQSINNFKKKFSTREDSPSQTMAKHEKSSSFENIYDNCNFESSFRELKTSSTFAKSVSNTQTTLIDNSKIKYSLESIDDASSTTLTFK